MFPGGGSQLHMIDSVHTQGSFNIKLVLDYELRPKINPQRLELNQQLPDNYTSHITMRDRSFLQQPVCSIYGSVLNLFWAGINSQVLSLLLAWFSKLASLLIVLQPNWPLYGKFKSIFIPLLDFFGCHGSLLSKWSKTPHSLSTGPDPTYPSLKINREDSGVSNNWNSCYSQVLSCSSGLIAAFSYLACYRPPNPFISAY
ncbi:hypothetical protein VNO77_44797 [Canavalia gladiata]|uniref:Uncharacterized protein n=1 Tax=Canavalia gladiata TaxID=3824 RepID=A0AAN9JXC2_CANGL